MLVNDSYLNGKLYKLKKCVEYEYTIITINYIEALQISDQVHVICCDILEAKYLYKLIKRNNNYDKLDKKEFLKFAYGKVEKDFFVDGNYILSKRVMPIDE